MHSTRFYAAAIAALCFSTALSGAALAQTVTDPSLTVQPVVTSGSPLSAPTSMLFLTQNDILVGEKNTGQVRRITNGALQPGNVLDLPVNNVSERGLLGMALSPTFPSDFLVYIFYTRSNTGGDSAVGSQVLDNRISRFTWNGVVLLNEQPLVILPATPGPNHNGGVLTFGPPQLPAAAQKLFAIIGDINRDNQSENFSAAEGGAAPDDSGTIIRINPDGSAPTGAQRGPFFDTAGGNVSLQHMFGYGIRNSYGLAFDTHPTRGGALWDTENGTGSYDEINRVDPAYNGGWQDQQGPTGFPGVNDAALSKLQFGGVGTYSDPEFSWRQVVAPTAMHFYSGTGLGGSYQYDCFVGCTNNGQLYRFRPNAARTGFVLTGSLSDTVLDTSAGDTDSSIVFGSGFHIVTDIKTGHDGNLYVLSFGHGQIYRIGNPAAADSGLSLVQYANVVTNGGGWQELLYNYSTGALTVTPYSNQPAAVPYELPLDQYIGLFHYDYSTARYSEFTFAKRQNL